MKTGASLKNRQGGAVAIMVGFSIFLLIGMAALVVDLGHLYLARTGLQNAADAAALSGAKQLDGTAEGICCEDGTAGTKLSAVYMAVTTGESNSFFGNLGQEQVNLGATDSSNPNIRFSRDPKGSEGTGGNWGLSIAQAMANPGGIYFIRVDTGSQSLSTWFAAIWNILNTSTKAVAVAGRGETPIAPIGVCAIDNVNEAQYISEDGNWPKYLVEWGFRRGTSYGFGSVNTVVGAPSGFASGAALYLHPTATSGDECSPIDVVPFLCRGTSAINGNKGSIVYENTGLNTGKAISALNTRFNVYDSSITGGSMSLAELQASCPPDSDITKYTPSVAAGWMTFTPFDQSVGAGSNAADKDKNLAAWLAQTVDVKTFGFDQIKVRAEKDGGCVDKPGDPSDCSNNYGVLWTNSRPLKEVTEGATPEDAQPSDWDALYKEGPDHVGSTWVRPYSGNQRRIINVVILNCYAPIGVGCQGVTVLGVGEFFLPTVAVNNNIFGEFSRLLPQPLPPAKIRLYR